MIPPASTIAALAFSTTLSGQPFSQDTITDLRSLLVVAARAAVMKARTLRMVNFIVVVFVGSLCVFELSGVFDDGAAVFIREGISGSLDAEGKFTCFKRHLVEFNFS